MKLWLKKLLHRHKYTTLQIYLPRPQYNNMEWGFLLKCEECGKVRLTNLNGIRVIEEMVIDNNLTRGN